LRRTRGGGPSSRGAARRHDAGIPAGRPQLRAASALVAALAALAFVVFGGCGTGSGDTVSKVVVLGIDGLDWQLIDPLIEQGRLPNIAALIERGVRADFRSLEPARPP